jgi:hypothetical protein
MTIGSETPMSFHLSQTPTLEAVSTDDEKLLALDMQARVAEACTQAAAMPNVAAAIDDSLKATEELARLRIAERSLHELAKESRVRLDEVNKTAVDTLVDAAASGMKPDWKKLGEATVTEHQLRSIGKALERLAEHLIPLAHIGSLREEAHSLEAQARTLQGIAQERAEKVLGQIREAVSDEMVLPVDMSKGVAGALLARAKELMGRAVRYASEADDLEQSYRDRSQQ